MSTRTDVEVRGRVAAGGRARLLAGLPVRERRFDVDGVATAALEAGDDGPPVLLLHGAIECGAAIWAPVLAPLAATHRLVVPDLPGLGESEPLARMDAETFGSWLAALIRRTCDAPPTVVAHSLGGSLAARFAGEHGGVLRALVIYGAPAIGHYRMPMGLRVVAIRFALRPSEHNAQRFDRWAFRDYDAARERDADWFAALSADTSSRARVPHVKRTMRRLITTGTTRIPDTVLRRIDVPVTLLWGRHDRFVPLGLATAAGTRLGWPLQVVDASGHVPHIERPAAFLDALGA